MESTEEAGRGEEEGEEEEEEESPKELESEEEEITMATDAGGLGFSALLVLGGRRSFAVKKSRFGVRLNSEKMEDGSAVSHSTRSQLQRRCVFHGGCSVFNGH